MQALSPAKINLFLNIVGKREDGYHLLESLFAPTNLADKIEILPNNTIECEVLGEDIPDNIVVKAAKLLKDTYGVKTGCLIKIEKHIPICAGLGGGSSNAATTLKLLSIFWELNLEDHELEKIALKLGADVPFFIKGQTAFVQGIGEIITPIKLNVNLPILLINPLIKTITAEVYKRGFDKFTPPIHQPEIADLVLNGKNDLYANALQTSPEIKEVITWLQQQPGIRVARMSGSGATCFGIFENEDYVNKARNLMPKNWWCWSDLLSL